MGVVLAILAVQSWESMPLSARTLVLLLAPVLLAVSIWAKPWSRMVKFIADVSGIYFPANELLVLSLHPAPHHPWLHVPWRNISNIRVAREVGEDGRCVALDVVTTSTEAAAFFKHIGQPRDDPFGGSADLVGRLSIAYSDSPPKPETTVQLLLSLKARGEA